MPYTIEAAFEELLDRQGMTSNQAEAARNHVEGISSFFAPPNFEMYERVFTIGSYRRGTMCDGEIDVDVMVPLSGSYWQRYQSDSRAFLYWVRDRLKTRYPQSKVSTKEVAVVLDFSVVRAEVVPCFKHPQDGYWMPNGTGGWQRTNPPFHTQLVEADDTALGKRLKPLIKLLKWWNTANGHHLSSFHVEMIVDRAKRGHAVGAWAGNTAGMLSVMPAWVRSTLSDPWAPGVRVDAYLRPDVREQVARMLDADAKASAEAETLRQAGRTREAFERWQVVYRHTFPAYGA